MIKKLAPLTGAAFFVLLLVSFFVGSNSLNGSSSGAKVLAHYAAHRNSTRVDGAVTVLAVFIGVIFFGFLRDYLRRHEVVRGWTTTAFGGALIFATSGGMSAGLDFAFADSPSHLSAPAAQALNLISLDLTIGLTLAGLSVMFFAFGMAIVRSGLLPAWLGGLPSYFPSAP